MDNTNKKILVHNKFYKFDRKISSEYCYNNNGLLNPDRLYSLVDKIINKQINLKNRFISFWFDYWFYNNDFKKNSFIASKKINKTRILINIFFILAIIGLVLCLIFGIAIPIIQSSSDTLKLMTGGFEGSLISNNKIVGWVLDQTSVINTINGIKSTLLSAQTNPAILDQTTNLWLKYYLTNYYMPEMGIASSALETGINHFYDYINMIVSTGTLKYIYFSKEIQVLLYFYLINNSLPSSIASNTTQLAQLFSSFNGLEFTLLDKSNIFYGLTANGLCLKGNQLSQSKLIPKIWESWFIDPTVILPLCLTLLLLFIVVFHSIILKKNKPKYKSMSQINFIAEKIGIIKKTKWLLRKPIFMDKKIIETKHNFVTNLQPNSLLFEPLELVNYVYSCLENMSIVLVYDYDENWLNTCQAMIDQSLTNLAVTVVDDSNLDCVANDDNISGFQIVNTINEKQWIVEQYNRFLENFKSNNKNIEKVNIYKKYLLNYVKNKYGYSL